MTGRPARGFINRVMREIGPISDIAPEFPLAGGALAPLHAKAQAQGSGDFSSMWAGQAAALGREMPARALTIKLAEDAQAPDAQNGGLASGSRRPYIAGRTRAEVPHAHPFASSPGATPTSSSAPSTSATSGAPGSWSR